ASTAPSSPGSAVTFTSSTQLSLALTSASTTRSSTGGLNPGSGLPANAAEAGAAPATAQQSSSNATTTSSSAATSGGGDSTPRSQTLTNDDLLQMWIIFEQTGEMPVAPKKPAPPPTEQKPATE